MTVSVFTFVFLAHPCDIVKAVSGEVRKYNDVRDDLDNFKDAEKKRCKQDIRCASLHGDKNVHYGSRKITQRGDR